MSDPHMPSSRREIEREMRRAIGAGNHALALAFAEAINNLVEPLHTEILYKTARLKSLLGDRAGAYMSLRQAVRAGYWNATEMQHDEAFKCIAEEPKFRKMIRAAWANGYIGLLERNERESFQKPDEVMKALALRPGERITEIGVGSGYFTVRVAKAIAPLGVVLGLDVSQEMLDYAAERIEVEGVENVCLRKVPRDDPQLDDGSVETILMVDVLHYVQDRADYAKRLRRALAPGGRVAVIDYRPKPWPERPWGPPPEQQVPREAIDAEMAAAGLVPVCVHDFLPEQYFVVYGVKP